MIEISEQQKTGGQCHVMYLPKNFAIVQESTFSNADKETDFPFLRCYFSALQEGITDRQANPLRGYCNKFKFSFSRVIVKKGS